jgi:hypothetical protein
MPSRTSAPLLPEKSARSLLNEEAAAHVLGLSPKTLQKWRVYGRGVRWIKLGTAVRYDPADLAAFIEAGRCTLP